MADKKLFGTDGIRGKANIHPMTPEVALKLGQAIAKVFQKSKKSSRIVIGKDTRRSSYMLEQAIASGVCSMGCDAVLLGPLSTPGVAFVTKAMRADAGIMISASHNSFDDNGIKLFDRHGYKLSDELELKIEEMILGDFPQDSERPVGRLLGRASRVDDAIGRYVEYLKSTFPSDLNLEGKKVVVDCANGAAYKVAPMVFFELGAEVVTMGVDPNGVNINKDCGALYPDKLAKLVLETKADMGVALDGDADRLILCDDKGHIIDGDQVIAMCALELKQKNLLKSDTLVGTIMSNMGVENYLLEKGIKMERTRVGDRYILELMRDQGFKLGGEPSGHVIFADYSTTGDGILAALQVLAAVERSGKTLHELVDEISLFPQVNQKILVKVKTPLEDLPGFQQALQKIKSDLGSRGRTVVRYSGTEPVLRLMIEGEDSALIQAHLETLVKVAQSEVGA